MICRGDQRLGVVHQGIRGVIYIAGILFVSAGIVLCKKSGLGISPISSVPYVLEYVVPMSFGTLTMLFHLINTGIQMLIRKKIWDAKLLLQIPLAWLFGQTINFFQRYISMNDQNILWQCMALLLSIVFTALGMVCMLNMHLIVNPPDGAVKEISGRTGLKFGNVKILYDISMVVISQAAGIVFCGDIKGVGIGTLLSAVLIGRMVTGINQIVGQRRMRL